MRRLLRAASLCFAAGAAGGLANSLVVWACGRSGLTAALGVAIAPPLAPAWLYPRLVWGGLWALLFLLPGTRQRWVRAGLVLSLAPSLAQLLLVFPQTGGGAFGVELGALTPLLVLLFNAVWGIVAGGWLRAARG